MKTETIRRLADRIEACAEVEILAYKPDMGPSFTMFCPSYACGAAACILGHNQEMHGRVDKTCTPSTVSTLSDDLGIEFDQAIELCTPANDYVDFRIHKGESGHITKAHAVAVLRNLMDTGEVDWTSYETSYE